jgi:hypothetical protein
LLSNYREAYGFRYCVLLETLTSLFRDADEARLPPSPDSLFERCTCVEEVVEALAFTLTEFAVFFKSFLTSATFVFAADTVDCAVCVAVFNTGRTTFALTVALTVAWVALVKPSPNWPKLTAGAANTNAKATAFMIVFIADCFCLKNKMVVENQSIYLRGVVTEDIVGLLFKDRKKEEWFNKCEKIIAQLCAIWRISA